MSIAAICHFSTRRAFLPALILLLSVVPSLAAMPHGTWTYDVYRGDDVIGTHQLAFSNSNDDLRLDVRTRIAVKMMYVVVYRFEQDGSEDWRDGHLAAMTTSTNDDGKKHKISLHRDGDLIDGFGDGHQIHAPGDILTGSLWDEDLVKSHELLNTITGDVMKINVKDLGGELVEVGNGPTVTAHHYSITGDLKREIWYGPDGRMVKLAFIGEDGSHIVYRIK